MRFLLTILFCLGIALGAASAQREALQGRQALPSDLPLQEETQHAMAKETWHDHVKKTLTSWLNGSLALQVGSTLPSLRPELVASTLAGDFTVYRPKAALNSKPSLAAKDAREALLAPYKDNAPDIHLKVIGSEKRSARVLIEIDSTNAPWIQQRLEWDTKWSPQDELLAILPRHHEETHRSQPEPLLKDRTAAVFAREHLFHQQLSLGIDDWRGRLESGLAPTITGFFGLAVGDANGDGEEDLFLCQPHGLPNRLFVRQTDGTLRDATATSELGLLDTTSSALFLDVDNDRDQDLLVVGDGFFIYHANDGKARFTKRQALPLQGTVTSLTAADYDRDGRTDVYVCLHTSLSQKDQDTPLGLPIPIHDANNGQANILFRNTADRGFVDITKAVGLDENNHRFSYAASWEDVDQDGDVDLYVANDFGRNNLYRNDKGRFTDVAASYGVEDSGSGMSVSWGDVNGDGWADLYVGNMYSSAGQRLADRAELKDLARGNALFLNQEGKRFTRADETKRVHLGRWAWSSVMADVNNDGWQDLLVANGFVTQTREDDL